MYEIDPINLDNGAIKIHPLRDINLENLDRLAIDIFDILGDEENTRYISEKKVKDIKEANERLLGITVGYEEQLGYTHFITLNKINKVIGLIDIHTPKRVAQEYPIKDKWFIEYYLNKQFWGHGIMTRVIKAVISNLKEQGIHNIAAVCMPENKSSVKILNKCGFQKIRKFDKKQDYFELE